MVKRRDSCSYHPHWLSCSKCDNYTLSASQTQRLFAPVQLDPIPPRIGNECKGYLSESSEVFFLYSNGEY